MQMQSAEELLKQTVFIVEANSFEQHTLWQQHCNKENFRDWPKMTWEQMHGWLVTVGKLDDRPVCISTSWVKVDGFLVMFWYECSQVADYVQTEKWLDENFTRKYDNGTRSATCDAMNFGHCISAIRELKAQKMAA
jgi:hypothetical protein